MFDVEFTGALVVSGNVISKAQQDVIEALKNGLPEEARRADVFKYILNEAVGSVDTILLCL